MKTKNHNSRSLLRRWDKPTSLKQRLDIVADAADTMKQPITLSAEEVKALSAIHFFMFVRADEISRRDKEILAPHYKHLSNVLNRATDSERPNHLNHSSK